MSLGKLCVVLLVAFCIVAEGRATTRGARRGSPPPRASTGLPEPSLEQAAHHHELLEHIKEHVREQLKEVEADEKADEEVEHHEADRHIEHVRPEGDNLEEANELDGGMEDRYQGDIDLTDEQLEALQGGEENREKRQALSAYLNGNGLWQTFYYSFAAGLPEHHKVVFRKAANIWQNNLCINFIESNTATPRVNVFSGQGCYSKLGRMSSQTIQELSLGTGCDSVGTALHEIGHALGFFHEQSRHDRDSAIEVLVNNIQPNWVDQFDKQTAQYNDNFNLPYDYGSIMQYFGTAAAASEGKVTMRARVPAYQDTMGSSLLSFRDIVSMNIRYKCFDKCNGRVNNCQNGGVLNPRDCTKCICPGGFGGATCAVKTEGCGETIMLASTTPVVRQFTFGSANSSPLDDYTQCVYHVKASPVGKKVRAKITSYTAGTCSSGCQYEGVELKWRRPMMLTGSRYCCNSDVGETVTSEDGQLPIIIYNRFRQQKFAIEFSLV